MKIAEVKKLDDGVSNIIIEGKIIKTPKEPRDSEYGWSQMIILKDDTDEMGSWINIENKESSYKVGQYIKVKGKVSKYMKGKYPGISLNNGNVIDEIVKVEDVSQEKPQDKSEVNVSTTVNNKDMDKVWEDKDLRTARESALKNIAQYVVAGLIKLGDRFDYAHEDVDFIYNGLEKNKPITSEAITKEFGGTASVLTPKQLAVEVDKEQKIAQARELVKNPHLTEPVNDKMATVPQKKQIYGYINEEGKKIGGMVDSHYIKKEEVKSIGKADKLTKVNGIKYWDYWYGKDEELGERDKRELAAKEKEGSPFITERKPLERRDPNNTTPLTKEVLIDDIQALRKDNSLEDDEKFSEAFGCNAKFKLWSEKELTKLKEKLEMYKPNWVTGE